MVAGFYKDGGRYTELLNQVKDHGITLDINEGAKPQNDKALGTFYSHTDQIILWGATLKDVHPIHIERIVAHEAIHGVLAKEVFNSSEKTTKFAHELVDIIEVAHNHRDIANKRVNEILDMAITPETVEEFVTYAFTHGEFADFLNSIPSPNQVKVKRPETMWDRFKKLIVEQFLPDGMRSSMDDVVDLMDDILTGATQPKKLKIKMENGKPVPVTEAQANKLESQGADVQYSRRVFHGSPHDIINSEEGKFTTSKIGTGEGAAAFGWGLYFTSKRSVAKWYADKLSQDHDLYSEMTIGDLSLQSYREQFNDKSYDSTVEWVWDTIGQHITEYNTHKSKDELLLFLNRDLNEVQRAIRDRVPHNESIIPSTIDFWDFDAEMKIYQDVIREIQSGAKIENPSIGHRNIYEVELHEGKNPDQYDYIQWYGEVNKKQMDKIEAQFHKEYPNKGEFTAEQAKMDGYFEALKEDNQRPSGEAIYDRLVNLAEENWFENRGIKELGEFNRTEAKREASEFLLRAGLDGIQFPTGSLGMVGSNGGLGMTAPDNVVLRFIDEIAEEAYNNDLPIGQLHKIDNKVFEKALKGSQKEIDILYDHTALIPYLDNNLEFFQKEYKEAGDKQHYNYVVFDENAVSIKEHVQYKRGNKYNSPLKEGERDQKHNPKMEMSWRDKFVRGMFNPLIPLRKLEEGDSVDPKDSGYIAHTLISNFPVQYEQFLKFGNVQYKDNWMTVDSTKGDMGIEGIVRELGNDVEPFFDWMTYQSAEEMIKKGRKNLFGATPDADMIEQLKQKSNAHYKPEWDTYKRKLQAINKQVLNFAEAAGMIDPETRQQFERETYIPFFRQVEDIFDADLETVLPKAGVNDIGKLHMLKGSDKHSMGDPMSNLISSYAFVMHESLRNLARKRSLVHALPANLVTKLPVQPKGKLAQRTVSIRHKGKAQYYAVNDPYLYDALIDLDEMSGGISQWWTKPKNWLTTGATIAPRFRLFNFVRDQISTSAVDEDFIPVVDSAIGLWHAATKSDVYRELASVGGAFGGSYHHRDVGARTDKDIQKLNKKLKGKSKVMSLLDFWKAIGEATENAARVGAYRRKRVKGKGTQEAAFDARDILDFHRTGKWKVVRFFAKTLPFFNARLQGLYKVGRAASGKQGKKSAYKFWLMSSMLGAASMMLHLSNEDDERYQELPDYEKLHYYHFWVGEQHIRVPVPFEVGTMASVLPMVFTDYARGKKQGKEVIKNLKDIATDTLAFNPVPQTLRPWAEQITGTDWYTGAPIVPMAEQRVDPELQYGSRTSKTARAVGAAIQKLPLPETVEKYAASPRRIDKLMKDYFSFNWFLTSAVTDVAAAHSMAFPSDPAGEDLDRYLYLAGVTPVAPRMVKKVPEYTRSQEKFYELMSEVDSAYATFNAYKKTNTKRAKSYFTEHKQPIKRQKVLAKFQEGIRKINQQIKLIRMKSSLTPAQKREKIDRLLQKRQQLFKKAIGKVEKVKG
jgi:hypothetical protein